MVERNNPEKPLGVTSVAAMLECEDTFTSQGIDNLIPVQNHHMGAANPSFLIGISQHVGSSSAVVAEEKQIIQGDKFSHVEGKLSHIEWNVCELHSEGL